MEHNRKNLLFFLAAPLLIAIYFLPAKASDFTAYPLQCGIYKMGGIIKFNKKENNLTIYKLFLAEKSYSSTSVHLKFTKEPPYKETWAILKVRVDRLISPYIVEASIIDTEEPKFLAKNLAPNFESFAVIEKEDKCLD